MKAEVVLTVAESKRLIAKGVAALDFVRQRLKDGIVVVTAGSTNGCIYEELTGDVIDHRAYLTGCTTPAKGTPSWLSQPLAGLDDAKPERTVEALPDLVLVNGRPDPRLDRFSALDRMRAGDVYIKGATALNYARGVAGITIGHPRGGTIGGAIGTIIGMKLRLLIPVGLEKEVPFDIQEAAQRIAEPDEHLGHVHPLWPVRGTIFTEIEALHVLCGVGAYPVAAGGVAGAEGGLRLLLHGNGEAVRQAVALVQGIQGEPPLG